MASLQAPAAVLSRTFSKNSFFSGYSKNILSPLCTWDSSSRPLVLRFSRRRQNRTDTPTSKTIAKKVLSKETVEKDDNDIDEDAFEALFSQLEEDLKNDELFDDGDDIDEEELAKLELELAEALTDVELLGAFGSTEGEENNNERDNVELDEADDEKEQVNLKNWQLRRLAYALKNGRRKTSIKNLAADLCLDRAVVLKLLREPPPNLVILSAALPDEPVLSSTEPSEEKVMTLDPVATPQAAKPKVEQKIQGRNWSAQKRLKKVQLETLEQVYGRTKRPTNSMISSIVHVTNLPRKIVIKWFEDKRVEDGVLENRAPYRRSATVFTNENSLVASSNHTASH